MREDETDTPERVTFYPIYVNPGDSLETSLWECEKTNRGTGPSGQKFCIVGIEHIAGPSCRDELGCNDHAIFAAEIETAKHTKILAYKPPNWKPEQEDQELEEDSECFFTGIGDRFPSRDMTFLNDCPARHG